MEAKDPVVLVRFFDHCVMKAVTRFIGLPNANDGTAAAVFDNLDDQVLIYRAHTPCARYYAIQSGSQD